MKEYKKLLRKSFYETLNGNLGGISVWDKRADDDTDLFVLLGSQTGSSSKDTFSTFDSEASFIVDIVGKTGNAVTQDNVDDVAALVINRVRPTPSTTGLVPQTGFQFLCVNVDSDNDLELSISPTQSIIRRIIRFSVHVHEL